MQNTFQQLDIQAELLQAIIKIGLEKPTDIQQKSIPILLQNQQDCIVLAKTGTGKTLAFGLPLLQLIDQKTPKLQAIILAPTRELGQQIFQKLQQLTIYKNNLIITSILGGVPIKPQIQQLQQTTHLVVATPGRLLDLIERKEINLDSCQFLVLDEADEMATAHNESLEILLSKLPKTKRTWLFSATMSGTVKQLVQKFMHKNTLNIATEEQNLSPNNIKHQYLVVTPIEKLDVLMHFLSEHDTGQGIIFCKTKAAVNKLAKNLAINRFSSGAIHGSLTQPIRDRIMNQFRDRHINILIATDLAARGLDIPNVAFVIHYHLPDLAVTYIHRSGRTARAGTSGLSLTIIQPEEVNEIKNFEKELELQFETYKKPNQKNIEANNAVLWAKQIFKTKPNNDIEATLKQKIKSVFHHLTKDELIEKLIANYFLNK